MWHFISKINDLSALHSILILRQPTWFPFFYLRLISYDTLANVFFRTLPQFIPSDTYTHTHSFSLEGVPQIAHWFSMSLYWTFQKVTDSFFFLLPRQSQLCYWDISHTATLPHSKASKRWEMHFKMQNTKQPQWQYHKIFHYPDTQTDQISNVLLPLLLPM